MFTFIIIGENGIVFVCTDKYSFINYAEMFLNADKTYVVDVWVAGVGRKYEAEITPETIQYIQKEL